MNAIRRRDVISYLTFAAIIAVVLFYFGTLGLRVNLPSDRTNLSMDVPDVNGLVAGSNVLLRGAPVGKVINTTTSTQAASIDFYVEGNYQIPVDTEVQLQNLSALGESYIQLLPRSDGGPMLKDNQRISTESVVQPPSISELATSVVRVLHQMDPDALARIISESDAALPDPVAVLPNLSRASTVLNNMLNGLDGQGRELLSNFQTLIRNSEWVNPNLTSLTPGVTAIGVNLQDYFKHLPILFDSDNPEEIINLNNLVARIQTLLDERGGDLKVLGEAFQPKLNTIAGTLMNFDSGQILDHFLQQAPADGMITLRVTP
ncbi:ABC transporter substrate-binding protein [Mycobacterium antarcticum]|uniref:MlaD family protein n=1 Tax=unclassified Mycolicibacterium TaxID=2636767 RepID=UPI002396B9AA|nr:MULTISPECIES: MlaD family protein [unclassified Mycolicibacterium]BDX33408.1 ABC transporter substrate-binding protein [Mycolicibacterium sp. TUM20985]GLP82978.1 ABC transporter substrate-binding protein [Mycolicibacterium sp. TUM20984]